MNENAYIVKEEGHACGRVSNICGGHAKRAIAAYEHGQESTVN